MTLALVAAKVAAAFSAASWPTSVFGIRALDARPEAIATGAALLLLASILRRSAAARRAE